MALIPRILVFGTKHNFTEPAFDYLLFDLVAVWFARRILFNHRIIHFGFCSGVVVTFALDTEVVSFRAVFANQCSATLLTFYILTDPEG